MKPFTRQPAVKHEAWARGTMGPELRDQDQGPEPGNQNQPEGKTGTQSIIRQEQTQISKTREQPRDPERQRPWDDRLGQENRQGEGGEGKEELSAKFNPLYMLQHNAILFNCCTILKCKFYFFANSKSKKSLVGESSQFQHLCERK
jgi:hypothetical protein